MKNYKELLDERNDSVQKLKKNTPDQLKGFGGLYKEVMKAGALDVKTKELIAVGTAVTSLCEMCIVVHVKNAVNAGANKQEILEAAWVAVMMGGGPALSYIQCVLKALEDFS